jgi:hypothetical protein
MALGAGALLFAVTVELYGHALRELEMGRAGIFELLSTVAGALVGCIFYLWVNRWLEQTLEQAHEETSDSVEGGENSHTTAAISPSAPSETTPLYRQKAPNTLGVSNALAEERRRWSQLSTPGGHSSQREDSFTRMTSWGAGSDDHMSIKSRGRDMVLNRISLGSTSGSPKPITGTPISPASIAQVDPGMAERGKHVAFALFLGILVDGVPEGLLMGFLAAEGHLSAVLIISLIVANFPEAFSSASLMKQGGVSNVKIVSMWTSLCIMVGVLAGLACFLIKHFFPTYPHGDNLPQGLLIAVAVIEGITGGAMIACIATVMLPEAFQRAGKEGLLCCSSGFLCTAGFLVAVVLKAMEHHYNNTHRDVPVYGHAFFLPGYGYW